MQSLVIRHAATTWPRAEGPTSRALTCSTLRLVAGRRRTSSQDAAAPPPPAQAVQQPVRASVGSDKGKQGEPWWQAAWRQLPSAHRDGATQAQGNNSSQEVGDEPGVLDRGGSKASQHAAAVGWGSGTGKASGEYGGGGEASVLQVGVLLQVDSRRGHGMGSGSVVLSRVTV